MEIVEAYFQLGHTSILKKWRHFYLEIVEYRFKIRALPPFSISPGIFLFGDIPPPIDLKFH